MRGRERHPHAGREIMSERSGRITISGPMLLDLLCLDPKTHRIVDGTIIGHGDVHITVAGPTMPESTEDGPADVIPEYRRKDWERIA